MSLYESLYSDVLYDFGVSPRFRRLLGIDPEAFRQNLEENVAKGSPSPAFLWPEDVTVWKDGTFGYVMALRPEGYHEMSEFLIENEIYLRAQS